jgi:hypothetical protein
MAVSTPAASATRSVDVASKPSPANSRVATSMM